jgi:hypothetical protein
VSDSDVWDAPRSREGARRPDCSISALGWASRAGLAIALLLAEYVLGWFLFFSPGWANGWPFGIRFQTVLSVVVTGWISLIAMTVLAGFGAMVGFVCALLVLGTKHGRRAYRIWLWIAVLAIQCFTSPLFRRIYAFNMEAFLDGYLIPQARRVGVKRSPPRQDSEAGTITRLSSQASLRQREAKAQDPLGRRA